MQGKSFGSLQISRASSVGDKGTAAGEANSAGKPPPAPTQAPYIDFSLQAELTATSDKSEQGGNSTVFPGMAK